MTFKEKLAKEHPGPIGDGYTGGCKGYPHGYGYEEEKPCKGINDEECTKCWDREMPDTPATMTAEEAWEIAKRFCCGDLNRAMVRKEVFGDTGLYACMNLPIQEIKAKIEEYDYNQIQVGDVIATMNGSAEYLVLRIEHNPSRVLRVCNIANGTVQTMTCEVKKTGKHIDIMSVLEQIGKEE